jgi:hypothetical protein
VWREFVSASYVSRLTGPDTGGLVVISDRPPPSLTAVLLAAFVPPFILLLVWRSLRKQRN